MDNNGKYNVNEGSPGADQTPNDAVKGGSELSALGKCELNSRGQEIEEDIETKKCQSEVLSEASVNPSVSTTSSGTVCRICQDGDEDGNLLRETGCSCRGSIRMIHDGCLMEWIRSQRSVICELCHDPFSGEHLEEMLQYWELLDDVEQLDNGRYPHFTQGDEDYPSRTNFQWSNAPLTLCDNSRRFWLLCIVIMVGLSMSSAFIQTTHMGRSYHDSLKVHQEHQLQTTTPSSMDLWLGDGSVLQPKPGIPDRLVALHSAYKISLIILGLTSIITTGVLALWVLAECCVWPLEKFMKTQLRRLARHERNALNGQAEQ